VGLGKRILAWRRDVIAVDAQMCPTHLSSQSSVTSAPSGRIPAFVGGGAANAATTTV
jgi:hypothetical protein